MQSVGEPRWLKARIAAPVLSCLLLIGGCAQNAVSLSSPSTATTPAISSEPGIAAKQPAIEPKPSVVAAATPASQIKKSEAGIDAQNARGPDQGPRVIVGFRNQTVIIYESEHSNVGQRVPASSLSLPITVGSSDVSNSRLPVPMVEGTRWLARADVMLK